MRKLICVLLCFIIMFFTGCGSRNENELPKNVRAIFIKWQDDTLIYHTDNGLFSYSPSDGKTVTLMTLESKYISNKSESWHKLFAGYFGLSPDKSKYILVTGGKYENALMIREANTHTTVTSIKYSDGIGQASWIDNENIFLTQEFELYIVNILKGEQVLVTDDSSSVISNASSNTELPYLSWAENVSKIGDKLYYSGSRDIENLSKYSIYNGDKAGEQEVLKNARLLKPVNEKHFVYLRESIHGMFETLLYDVETGKSSIVTNETLLEEGIFVTNDGKLCFMTGDMLEGIYQGVVYNPDTMQKHTFDIYNGEKDFPDKDIDRRQFGHFMGAFEKDGEWVFLFSVENFSISQGKYIKEYLAYSTKTKKLIEIDDYGDTWLVNMNISPSGEFIVVTKHKSPGDDDLLFDLIKSDTLIMQLK